jgi:pimeloyl-ACP methyl ester carboxylesterase
MRIEVWEPQIKALSHSHRVIALDLPGHGESDRLPDSSPLPAFVSWLGGVLDDLGLDSINLAGHSMGAMISGGAAATFGRRIARVALFNGLYRRTQAARAAVLARADEIIGGQSIDFAGPIQRWFGQAADPAGIRELILQWLQTVDVQGYATAYSAFARGDVVYADAWPDITCPALFVTGSDDPNSTPAMSRAMSAAAPRGKAIIIEGHRHMVNLTAPDLVNDILKDWLAELVAAD